MLLGSWPLQKARRGAWICQSRAWTGRRGSGACARRVVVAEVVGVDWGYETYFGPGHQRLVRFSRREALAWRGKSCLWIASLSRCLALLSVAAARS